MRASTALLVVLCAAATTARAEGPDDVTMMRGVCRKLATPDGDLSAACRGGAVTASYTRQGRVGFRFSGGDRAVTFSGGAKAIRIGDATGVQAIDAVTIAAAGAPAGTVTTIVAVGSCRYADALTTKPTVNCKAETEEGIFLAIFDLRAGDPPALRAQ